MERNALEKLIEWNNDKDKKPLIVWGARQVGKTYLILELFAKRFYNNSYIYIDFKIEDEVRSFCDNTANAKKIIEYLELKTGISINENTLLIFDEIQECPNVISSLKYFCQDYRQIPVIVTGSMVRIKLQRETHKRGVGNNKFLFPVGKINQITIYPMSFDEYLLNYNKLMYEMIKSAYQNKEALSQEKHNLILEQFYKYLLIGGMPEAVNNYLKNNSLLSVRKIITDLYSNYLADMELYQASPEAILKSRAVYNNIFKELNKESKNFSPSLIQENTKTRDYETAINWLSTAHIVNKSYQLKEHVTLPLIEEDATNFRLYLADIGLFSYQSGINASSFVSNEKENVLSGIFFENYVANELVSKGHKLFYWRGKAYAEFEFLVESNNKLYPIDVKKGRGNLNSLDKFSAHNKFECAIKISNNNYNFDKNKKILTMPFYYVPFLAEDLANGDLTINQNKNAAKVS